MRSQPSALLAAGAAALLASAAQAQYVLTEGQYHQYLKGTVLFNQTYASGVRTLVEDLQNHPDVEDIYYPNKYVLPRDFYTFAPPDRENEYTQNVIFDPCRGYGFDCCMDTYGTPEFLRVVDNATQADYGKRYLQYDDGGVLESTISRRPDDEYYIDESCEGEGLPLGRVDCVMARVGRQPFPLMPRCWNWNESITADASCRSPADGAPLPLCMEVGITQTAFIVECGGPYMFDPHCGTYLEIHRPGRADKLSETKLRGTYTSGYRMTVISTTYKEDDDRVLCWDPVREGKYELWWVQRTLYNFIVERRVPFQVVSPQCDWDGDNNRYLPYATRATALQRSYVDPFEASRLLFTRARREGQPGRPGKGMGSRLVEDATDDTGNVTTYPDSAIFDPTTWKNEYTYTYTPDLAEYTVKRGLLEPSLAEQQILAELLRTRGYRRLRAEGRHEEADAMRDQAVQEAMDLFK